MKIISTGKADTSSSTNSPVFTGTPKTSPNDEYATAQLRNIILSTNAPTDAQGENGDIWIVYEA